MPNLSDELNRKGLECLFYLTHLENLPSILERGILSYNRVQKNKIQLNSIANPGVQLRRIRQVIVRPDFVSRGLLHDFVPLYMVSRNPMLWAVHDNPLAYIRISLKVADIEGTVFSNGNAAAEATKFYADPSDVERLPWDVIFGQKWTGGKIVDGRRKRCAEILIPDVVENRFFLDIRCNRDPESLAVPSQFRSFLKFDPQFLEPSKARKGISMDSFFPLT